MRPWMMGVVKMTSLRVVWRPAESEMTTSTVVVVGVRDPGLMSDLGLMGVSEGRPRGRRREMRVVGAMGCSWLAILRVIVAIL